VRGVVREQASRVGGAVLVVVVVVVLSRVEEGGALGCFTPAVDACGTKC
jgi:hypothetical protein